MIDYQPLIARWAQDDSFATWADELPGLLETRLSHQRYGDLSRWLAALDALPDITPNAVNLDASRVGCDSVDAVPAETLAQLHEALQVLHPWRKGPFELFGVHIDTEWRSDWKWDRLARHIDPLPGRRVLDVGCGSGSH